MTATDPVDEARPGPLLDELRPPGIRRVRSRFAERADKEGWPAARHLAALAERERAERERRRVERHLAEARPPPGETLDGFDVDAVPMGSKARVMASVAGDGWLEKGDNLLVFAPPGGGKSHPAAGLGLVENGWRVPFTRTTDLVRRLQVARRELAPEAAIARLDKSRPAILDDRACVTKDQAETGGPFELVSARHERRSAPITANQPFGEWNGILPDPPMTLAAVDRLVRHATLRELDVESCRRRAAVERRDGPGRPPTRATVKTAADRRSATIKMRKPLGAAVDAAIIQAVAALRLLSRSPREPHPDCRQTGIPSTPPRRPWWSIERLRSAIRPEPSDAKSATPRSEPAPFRPAHRPEQTGFGVSPN